MFNGCDALETVILPDGTFTFGKRNLKWGIPSAAHLVTHKELITAEELLKKALETPLEASEEEETPTAIEENTPAKETESAQ